MDGQAIDPRVRNRFLVSATLAIAAVTVVGTFSVLAQMMDIDRVVPPQVEDMLTMQVVVQGPPAAEPPPRPEPPVRNEAPADTTPHRVASAPLEDVSRSGDDGAPPSDEPSTGSKTKLGFGDGDARAGPCLPPACVVGVPKTGSGPFTGDGSGRPRNEPAPAAEPIDVMRARAKYDPNPDAAELGRTPTGLGSRRPGSTTVAFCVATDGTVDTAKVEKSFGDPQVDAIVRRTVKRWRFEPLRAGGKARRSCSAVTFRIEFD